MKRNFSVNLLFLVVLNLLIKPIYVFGIEVGIQNTVGPAEYGLYYAMFNFTFLFNVVLDMGINNFQKIKVAEDNLMGIRNMTTLLPLKAVLSLLYFAVTIGAALIIGFEGRYWFFIVVLMFNHVLSAFLLLLRANISGLQLFFRDSIVSVIDRGILILAIGYLLWFSHLPFHIEYLAILQTAAYIIAIITALLITPAASRSFSFQLDIGKMRSMIRATWPYALLILLMTAYNKLDGVMLERLAQDGLVEAGIYAQAYRIIDAGNSFAFLYAGMLLPIFSRLISTNKSDDLRNLIDQGARFLVIPAGLASVLMVYKAEWFMDLLYTSSVVESANAFQWLMGSFLFICMGYVFGTYLTASNQLAAMNWIAFAAVIVNITLNVALIPNLGAHGAALASFSSLLIMALAQIVLVYRSVSIRLFQWFWRGLVCWISLAITGYAINQVNLSDLSAIGLLIAAAIVLYVLIGLKRSDLKTAIPS